jgi:hypothetical protein
MGRKHKSDEGFLQFELKNLKGRDDLEDLGTDGRTVTGCACAEWIHMAEDTDQWEGLVEHATEPSSPIKGKEFLD